MNPDREMPLSDDDNNFAGSESVDYLNEHPTTQEQNNEELPETTASTNLKTEQSHSPKNTTLAPNNFKFPKIIDIFSEMAQNNFLPLFKLLEKVQNDKSIDLLQQNTAGYNVFHLLLCSSNFPLVKLVLKNFSEFAFAKTSAGQTNLMIAINQANFDIIRFVDERSHNSGYAIVDAFGFDIFMYMIRNNSIDLFVYFLQKYIKGWSNSSVDYQSDYDANDDYDPFTPQNRPEIHPLNKKQPIDNLSERHFLESIFALKVKDNNGCGMVHWACFRNSEFLVRLLFRFCCDLRIKDTKGFLPIDRATENNSVRVIYFLESYSVSPCHTNYYLFGKHEPSNFDFFPDDYEKIASTYQSEGLQESFLFKKGLLPKTSLISLRSIWRINNPRYRFGLIIYLMWLTILALVAPFNKPISFLSLLSILFYTILGLSAIIHIRYIMLAK